MEPKAPYLMLRTDQKRGFCKKMVKGKPCGKPFIGTRTQKYCCDCSKDIAYRGRG